MLRNDECGQKSCFEDVLEYFNFPQFFILQEDHHAGVFRRLCTENYQGDKFQRKFADRRRHVG